jgi:LysM repeat protein
MIFFVKKPINEEYQYQNIPTVEYKIQKGDTLWGISHKFTSKNHQEFIYLIKKMNNLDNSLLMVDQILLLPVNI